MAVPGLCSPEEFVRIQPFEEKAGEGTGNRGNRNLGNVSVYLAAVSLMALLEPPDPSAGLSQMISECPERDGGVCSHGGGWRNLILVSSSNYVFLKLFKNIL